MKNFIKLIIPPIMKPSFIKNTYLLSLNLNSGTSSKLIVLVDIYQLYFGYFLNFIESTLLGYIISVHILV